MGKGKDLRRLGGTGRLEGVVGKPVGVRVPPSAPSQYSKGIWLRAKFPFFVLSARVAQMWLGGDTPCDVGEVYGVQVTYILAICSSDETPKESEPILCTRNKPVFRDKSVERLEVRNVYIHQLLGTGDGLSFRAGGGNRRGCH